MKLAIIGDVHAELEGLKAVIRIARSACVEHTLCVGDICHGSVDIEPCVDVLRQEGVQCVSGNHDRWALEASGQEKHLVLSDGSRQFLEGLPKTLEIDTRDGLLMLCHGLGSNDMGKLAEDDFKFPYTLENNPDLQAILAANRFRFVVGGHTHKVFWVEHQGVFFGRAGTLCKRQNPGVAIVDSETATLSWIGI